MISGAAVLSVIELNNKALVWWPSSGQVRINKGYWKAEGDVSQQQIKLFPWFYVLSHPLLRTLMFFVSFKPEPKQQVKIIFVAGFFENMSTFTPPVPLDKLY